jgi:WD40 repeat protein
MSDYLTSAPGDPLSPPNPGGQLLRWCGRHWAALTLGVGCLALAVVAGTQRRETLDARASWEATREQLQRAEEKEKDARLLVVAAAGARANADKQKEKAEQAAQLAESRRKTDQQKAERAEEGRRRAEREREKSDAAREEARTQVQVTEGLRREAVEQRRQALLQMVRLYVAHGTRLQDSDLSQALLWFAEALRLADRERLPPDPHRLRLAIALGRHPRLLQAWFADQKVNAARVSPDGRQVLTAGADGLVHLWDAATGREVGRAFEHSGSPVIDAAFSPDGRRVLTVTPDGGVSLWDAAKGEKAATLAHEGPVTQASFSADGRRVLTVTEQRRPGMESVTVQVWDAAKGEAVGKPFLSSVGLVAAALTPDGRRVVVVGSDKVARLWDPETEKQVSVPLNHGGGLTQAALSADGRLLLTAGLDRTARVWQAATGQPAAPPLKHPDAVIAASFSADGRRVLTVSRDRAVRLWDAASGELTAGPLRHPAAVTQAAFSPDGRQLLTACADGEVRVWDAATGEEALPGLRHAAAVQEAAFSPDGAAVLTREGGAVRLWDLTVGEPPAPPPAEDGGRTWFSPDSRHALLLHRSEGEIFTLDKGQPVGAPLKPKFPISSAAFSADGKLLLTVGNEDRTDGEGEVRLWDAATGAAVGAPLEHIRAVTEASFSADGRRVLTVCEDKKVRVWDAATGQQLSKKAMDHPQPVTRAVFSPDGRMVVTAMTTAPDAAVAQLWDGVEGERVKGTNHGGPVTAVAFSADGRRLLTAGADGGALVWESPGGDQVSAKMEHGGAVSFAAFSPDGKRVVTLCADGTARAWDAASGTPVTTPLPHPAAPALAAFSPDGRRLAVAGGAQVWLWDAATGDALGPPLRHARQGTVNYLAYTPEGRLVTASGAPGDPRARVTWDLAADARPVADLVLLAESLSGHRLDDAGNLLPWAEDEAAKAWPLLHGRYPRDFAAAPERLLAWHRRGADECERQQNWAGAVTHLGRMIAARPVQPDLYARRAQDHAAAQQWDGAVADHSRAIELAPDRWDLRAARAADYAALRQWDRAAADFAQAIVLRPDGAELWAGRGRAEAELGQWDKAAADFGRAITLGREDAVTFRDQALARLGGGDAAGYRRLCGRMVRRFAGSRSPEVERGVGWACALVPDVGVDLKGPLGHAERALADHPKAAAYLLAVGALQYRGGQLQPALQNLQKAQAARAADDPPYDWLLLAMTQQRLGRGDEAKKWLGKAVAWAEPGGKGKALPWPQRVELRQLRQEAEALVKGAKP